MPPTITLLPALTDNYIYLVHDDTGAALVVDPGAAAPVLAALESRDLRLAFILTTHHHADHTGGTAALKHATGAALIGPAAEAHRIPHLDRAVRDGDTLDFGPLRSHVIATPGHTAGHIAFHFPELRALFCGDTLFSLGCGRLFEGTPAQMWDSLKKLRALPDDTLIYCGHEYTAANAAFATALDPATPDLKSRAAQIATQRHQHQPTIPSLLGDEKRCNPFLRADDPIFRATLATSGLVPAAANPATAFGLLRTAKDRFKA